MSLMRFASYNILQFGLVMLVFGFAYPIGSALGDPSEQEPVGKILTRSMDQPLEISRRAKSILEIDGVTGTITDLGVYIDLESRDARSITVYLTSPLGTKIMLVNGEQSDAITLGGIEGWLGTDGISPAQSLKTLTGEPLNGSWTLTVETNVPSRLLRWSINSSLKVDSSNLGTATYSMYTKDDGGTYTRGETSGCDCQIGDAQYPAATLLVLVIGLLFWRRRTKQ